MTETIRKTLKAHCNDCRHETNHTILETREHSGEDDVQGWWWTTRYDMIECRGCETISLRRVFNFSENREASIEFYPPRVSRWLPEWYLQIPQELRGLLCEVYRALHADSRRLALMGARTVIERAMIEKIRRDQGSFSANLHALEQRGHVSCRNRQFLEVALEAGHAAAHRAHSPSAPEVNTVMDIVENMLQSIFALEDVTKELKAKTPRRPRRPKRKKAVLAPSTKTI